MEDTPMSNSEPTSDTSPSPAIIKTYSNGDNVISFPTTYTLLKSLLAYPPCLHGNKSEPCPPWVHDNKLEPSSPCPACETDFTTDFWSATATLLDYFADFFPTDTALMQSLWFHFVDMWQSAVLWLRHDEIILESLKVPLTDRYTPDVQRARQFKKDFELARKLVETVIYGPSKMARGSVRLSEDIIHRPDGKIDGPPSNHETGPWISGLKPWQQWLCAGSPGVAAPLPADLNKGERVRHIPMSAIAIAHKHTSRARQWAAHLAAREPDTVTKTMARFDAHALRFPRTGKTAGYTSLHGHSVRYTLVNGAPPVSRKPGPHDDDAEILDANLTLVDECVALYKGQGTYVAQSGFPEKKDGDQEEGEAVVEDAVHGWFDMWTVVEGREVVEENRFAEGLKDVFEEWGAGGQAQRVDRPMEWT